MKLIIINGPNLNMLGIREKELYGDLSYNELEQIIIDYCEQRNINVKIVQSNHEGDLIDYVQSAYFEKYDGVILNPGAYAHTSIALRDAVNAIQPIPVIEVHLTNIFERESFRQKTYLLDIVLETIYGEGVDGYIKAIQDITKCTNLKDDGKLRQKAFVDYFEQTN